MKNPVLARQVLKVDLCSARAIHIVYQNLSHTHFLKAMHIPDGILTSPVCATTLALGGAALATATYKCWNADTPGKALGLAAAGTILVQALNFPVSASISGHFIGSALLAWMFGPWAALCVLGMVLGTQAFLLGDGGIFAFGANFLCLAIVPILLASVAKIATENTHSPALQSAAAGVATLTGYLAASVCVTLLLTFGAIPGTTANLSLVIGHSWLPAILEGFTTAMVVALLISQASASTDLIETPAN